MNKKKLLSTLLAFTIILSILIPTIYTNAEEADMLASKATEAPADTESPAIVNGEGETPAPEATASDSPAIEETPEPELNPSASPTASPVLDLPTDPTTIELLPKIDDKLCYQTGEEVCFQANIHLSDEDALASGTVLEIALPNICLNGINAPEIDEATLETDDKTTDGITYIRYTFDSLVSGITLSIPITIETSAEITDSFTLPINATVLSAKGNKLAVAEELALQFEPVASEEGTAIALFGKGVEPFDAGADPLLLFTLAPTIAGKLEYLTGETVAMNMTIDMSSVTATMHDVTVKITIPNNYMDLVTASDLTSATKTITIDTVAKVRTITYVFSELTGGTSIVAPFTVRTRAGLTPDNYVLPVDAQMLDALGVVQKTADTVNLTYQTIQPIFDKMVRATSGITSDDNHIIFAGFADTTDPNLVSMTDTVPITFSYGFINGSDIGYRKFSQHTIRDTLPEGAVFDAAINPSWTYDEATRVATYVSPESDYTAIMAQLKLRFPGGTVLTQPYTNTMEAEFIPVGAQPYEDEFSAQDTIKIVLSNDMPGMLIVKGGPQYVVDQMTEKQSDIKWTINYSNPSPDIRVSNVVLVDSNLDPRLTLTKIKIFTSSLRGTQPDGGGTINVEAVDTLGNATVVASNLATPRYGAGNVEVTLPAGTAGFRIIFVGTTAIEKSGTMSVEITSRFIDPEGTHATGDTLADQLKNTATATANYQGYSTEFTASVTAITPLIAYTPQLILYKSCTPTSVYVNDQITTTLTITPMDFHYILAPDVADLQKLVDLLPVGFELDCQQ